MESPGPSLELVRALRPQLLAWFDSIRRPLPWRASRDSYRVWVSEVMLQQTRVQTVLDYWPRFLETFPTVEDLAMASEDQVLAVWSGLGYYSRARQLHRAAKQLVAEHGGVFPRSREEALALPGVGPYTAGAVLSIAYGLPEPLVDGNVIRVYCRLFGLEGDPASGPVNRELWWVAGELMPDGQHAGDWNQGVMELGSLVCTPRSPQCDTCPLAASCVAKRDGRTAELPQLAARPVELEVALEILVVRRGARILFEKRPAKGRMAGMWQLPTVELANSRGEFSGLFPPSWPAEAKLRSGASLGSLRHGITRHRIQAEVREGELRGDRPESWRWLRPTELEGRGVTGMTKKVLKRPLNR